MPGGERWSSRHGGERRLLIRRKMHANLRVTRREQNGRRALQGCLQCSSFKVGILSVRKRTGSIQFRFVSVFGAPRKHVA